MKNNIEDNPIEFFRLLMFHLGTTYPKHIFNRRLKFLTKKERKEYDKRVYEILDKIYDQFMDEIDDIDSIMSIRAEIKKDPWE